MEGVKAEENRTELHVVLPEMNKLKKTTTKMTRKAIKLKGNTKFFLIPVIDLNISPIAKSPRSPTPPPSETPKNKKKTENLASI